MSFRCSLPVWAVLGTYITHTCATLLDADTLVTLNKINTVFEGIVQVSNGEFDDTTVDASSARPIGKAYGLLVVDASSVPPAALSTRLGFHSLFERNYDCGLETPHYQHATYNTHNVVLILMILFAFPINIEIISSFFKKATHPKFLLRRSTTVTTGLHLTFGSLEICLLFLVWFASDSMALVRLYSVVSLLHIAASAHQITLAGGMKVITNSAFLFILGIKAWLALRTFWNTDCYVRVLELGAVHTVYAWVRVFDILMSQLDLFRRCRQTVCVLGAALIVMPAINALYPIYYIIGGSLYAFYVHEFKRDDEHVMAFMELESDLSGFLTAQSPFKTRAVPPGSKSGAVARAEIIFDTIDKDCDGTLSESELATALVCCGLPASEVSEILISSGVDDKTGMDLELFQGTMGPLSEWMYPALVEEVQYMDRLQRSEKVKERLKKMMQESCTATVAPKGRRVLKKAEPPAEEAEPAEPAEGCAKILADKIKEKINGKTEKTVEGDGGNATQDLEEEGCAKILVEKIKEKIYGKTEKTVEGDGGKAMQDEEVEDVAEKKDEAEVEEVASGSWCFGSSKTATPTEAPPSKAAS